VKTKTALMLMTSASFSRHERGIIMGKLLSEIFDLGSIKINLNSKTKELALTELIDAIAVLHPKCAYNELFTAIMERENKMSTGIGNGFAIPHARCRGIPNIGGAIGISKQGIDFGSIDNKPVHIILLIATSERVDENHLHIFSLIAKLAESEKLTLIRDAKNAQEIYALLSRIN
jgi:mannitol/fructose-specific phosphotransferase system IIA component (Ntr-type)